MTHFRAFLWLRWRLRINQLRRGGAANIIILVLFAILLLGLGTILLGGGLLVGLFALKEATPRVFLLVLDGVLGAMLFVWCIGLFADLQRSDPLTLDKVLHLPVSPTGAFVINYVSSLFNVTLILFLAAMSGLSVGLLITHGPAMLVLVPLVAAFVLALTALTYQFQGWLASLMSNPRRRRTIIVFLTGGFILIAQVPNLINLAFNSGRGRVEPTKNQHLQEQAEWREQLSAGAITAEEFNRRVAASVEDQKKQQNEQKEQREASIERTAWVISVIVPPGWVGLGAAGAAGGNFAPALLGTLGLGLIGGASLWRAYRTTLRIYTGQYTAGTAIPQPVAAPLVFDGPPVKLRPILLEKRLPLLPEQASAVALSSFAAMLRAPEVKMIMLSPLIMGLVFGTIALSNRVAPPELMRPFIVLGSMAMVLLTMQQLCANQFGFDRAGFRVFVLCPASRRDILLGKNVAVAPLPLFWGVVALVAVQVVYRMRPDHFLAGIPQILSMYLIYCMMANWLSIFSPLPISQGTFKPTNARLVPVLLNLVAFLCMPMLFSPVFLPLGLEYVAAEFGGLRGWPINLGLSVFVLALVVPIYWLMLGAQGKVLQQREQAILKVVTSKE